jgi:hypothetical protein
MLPGSIGAEEDIEAEVGVEWSKPFLEREVLWDCWVDTCEVDTHRAGNSTKRETPCDCMLAANCTPMMVASDGKVDEPGEVLFDSSCDVGVERSRHLYNLLPEAW